MRLAVFFSVLLIGCASPSGQFLDAAKQYGFENQVQQGKPYLHRLFLNSLAQKSRPPYEELHVYLDGDGTPFINSNIPSDDPTARQFLILDLLSKDKKPAILLGRPCYYGFHDSAGCQSSLWTSARYSQDVVNSLVFTLQQWLKIKPAMRLVFIGHSGGGTLATLFAAYFPQTSDLITIAGNLDIKAWCDYHGYTSLSDSLNPIENAHVPVAVKQLHLVGNNDQNVLAQFNEKFSQRYQNSHVFIFDGYNHTCCWADMWEKFLEHELK